MTDENTQSHITSKIASMVDERPIKIYIHPKLKNELYTWHTLINDASVKKTGYPIPEGMPLASRICSEILSKVRLDMKKCDMNINTMSRNRYTITIELRTNNKLNLELHKREGLKKHDVEFE